jgi:outer membrane protein assembly factor BamB
MDSLTATDLRSVGEFRLLARLGSGGMGQVFLGSSLAGRIVAVKVIHAELCRDAEFIRRFRNEVEAAQKVSGWYTAPVVAAGVDDNPPWLATAFVPGPSLEDIVTRYGPLPLPAVWRLAAGLADALRAVHAAGLIHRDLKPANVLLALDGPRVIDFGISRAVADTRLTATGAIIGTLGFMSPEQVQALETGPASDTFSLGSVLAFAAAGHAPFSGAPGAPAASVMFRIVHGEPDLSAVPAGVRGLIEACLSKDPGQRPDLRQVAAHGTATAERLGLSPAAFWPPAVARVIEAHQATLNAQIEAVRVAPGTHADGPWGSNGGPTSPGRLGAPATTWPPAASGPGTGFAPGGPAVPWQPAAARGTSRRGLLIAAGAGSIAVIGGAAGWALSTRAAVNTPGASATTPATLPTGAALPTSGSLPQYYGSGARRTAAWKFPTHNSIEASPGAGGGMVYVASTDNNVYAVNIATRRQAWSFPAESVTAPPELVGDVVCLSTNSGHFYALRAASGARAWDAATNVPAIYKRTWAADGGNVIFGSIDSPPRAYDAATGAAGVSYSTQEPYVMALTVDGGILYAIDAFGMLYAFHAAAGTEIWHKQLLSSQDLPGTGLTVDNGGIYLGTVSGALYKVSTTDGRVLWTYQPGNTLQSNVVVADGIVYLRDNNGTVHAVRAADKKELWSKSATAAGIYGPAVAGGRVYYSTALALQALDAKTGAPVWAFSAPGNSGLLATPVVAGGFVFIGSYDDALYAVQA